MENKANILKNKIYKYGASKKIQISRNLVHYVKTGHENTKLKGYVEKVCNTFLKFKSVYLLQVESYADSLMLLLYTIKRLDLQSKHN